jgi:major membrane immunogen (membrane-anchored lipoprotein)
MKNIIFILALLLTSCGSRKVAINNTEIKKDSTAITEVKVEEEIKVEIEEKIMFLFLTKLKKLKYHLLTHPR